MTVIIQEVYHAFKEAGVSEEKAISAAAALSEHKEELNDIKREIVEIRGILKLYQWMMGFILGLLIAVLLLLLRLSIVQ